MTISGMPEQQVTVTIEGEDPRLVADWAQVLKAYVRDLRHEAQDIHPSCFIIKPRERK